VNAFVEHHKDSIRFRYQCFDRILLNGLIQPFQQPERVICFFNTYRNEYPVSRGVLHEIADQFHNWVVNRSQKWGATILEAPEGRRDDFVDRYFRRAQPDQVVAILKAREPARIIVAIGNKKENRWHLQIAQRWVIQYNFYVNDKHWGRMFVRVCPYLPFSARVCLNQHHWLANRLRQEGVAFRQCSNAFLNCSNPERLQQLADSLTSKDLLTCGQKWLAYFTPFFRETERRQAGCQHRLFFAQVEYCDNLLFFRRAALDQMGERLLDANRTIGRPNKITVIFGRKVTRQYRGKLQTVIEDIHLPNPVIRSHYGNCFIKQYVRDHLLLRTEAATNNVNDYGVKKAIENLPKLRERLASINDNYLNIQQDILETFVDRGQLRQLAAPTILSNGKRIPGLKLDHPRQIALMHALVRFAHVAAGIPSVPLNSSVQRSKPWAAAPLSTRWRHFVTTFPNSEPSAWSRKFREPADIGCCRRDIPFASCSSSYSSAFMHRWLLVCCAPSAVTHNSKPNHRNLIASISVLWTTSKNCSQPWASKRLENLRNGDKILVALRITV